MNAQTAKARRPRPDRAWLGDAVRWTRAAGLVQAAAVVAVVALLVVVAEGLTKVVDGTPLSMPAVAAAGVLVLASAGLAWWAEVLAVRAETQGRARLRQRLFGAILAAGPSRNRTAGQAESRTVLTEGAQAVAVYFARYLPAALAALVAVLATTVALLWADPVVAGIAVAGVLVSQLLPLAWLALVGGPSMATLDSIARSNRVFIDNVRGLPTAKAFNAVPARRAVLATDAERLRRTSMRVLWYGLSWGGVQQLCALAAIAATTLAGVLLWQAGATTVRTPLLALLTLPVAFAALSRFTGNRHGAMDAQQAAEPIRAILAAAPAPALGGPAPLPAGDVVLDDVVFGYPDRTELAVDGVGLTLPQGSTTAVIGPSGAGKSTIADLLLRFARPQRGRITIGGTDLASIDADALYRTVTLVSQDTYLFHGSIRDNLTIARPDTDETGADEAELREALGRAGLAEFVDALPEGLDTPIGEGGEQLSGGQRQRVAIARALLTGARVIVFDEATARLDGRSERTVLDAIAALPADRTVLMIAHRLSAVRGADRIVVLEAGRIVQTGTHDQLAADPDGRYAALMRTQVTA